MVVEQDTARKHLTLLAIPASCFCFARSLLSFINSVRNATTKQLKRHLPFNLWERLMIRGFQRVPI